MNGPANGSEEARIEALHAEGRLTREQADRLLDALRAGTEAEREADREIALVREGAASPDAGSPSAEETGVPATPETAGLPVRHASATPGQAAPLRWLEVNTFAGDIDIKAEPGLTQPVIREGNLELTPEGARAGMFAGDEGQANIMDRLIDGFRNASLKVRIPTDWGVRFDVKGGDIDIEGPVAAVIGTLAAGDLEIKDTRAVDVNVIAGEAEVGLRADSGEHRVRVRVGTAEVRVLPGSSLNVDAGVNIGSIRAPGLNSVSSGIGMKAAGLIDNGGTGSGNLSIEVVTGEAELKVVRP